MKSRMSTSGKTTDFNWENFEGRVSGASSDLYRGENANVSINTSAPLAIFVLPGAAEKERNFVRNDVKLVAYGGKALGVGAGTASGNATRAVLN